ncbi:ExbD/TolR family protein [Maridesulfovibrio sp.]|uniref:ExbD/TolR family protein n=1 Tax=Maridesulfovibrio sp. TaxID=2795000 RepID=UPI0039F0C707
MPKSQKTNDFDAIPSMPVSITEIGFILSIMFLACFLMAQAHETQAKEKNLPAVILSKLNSASAADDTKLNETPLTINKGKSGLVYHVGKKQVLLKNLSATLKDAKARYIAIRADGEVRHKSIMKVVELCQNSGAESFTFVYEQTD